MNKGEFIKAIAEKAGFTNKEAGIAYEYLDFSEELKNLKEFLKIRDGNPLFDELRAEGKIGIPCIVTEDGRVTLDWSEFL